MRIQCINLTETIPNPAFTSAKSVRGATSRARPRRSSVSVTQWPPSCARRAPSRRGPPGGIAIALERQRRSFQGTPLLAAHMALAQPVPHPRCYFHGI